jgi:glycosyltransferase involved in cell wall biosynthesis
MSTPPHVTPVLPERHSAGEEAAVSGRRILFVSSTAPDDRSYGGALRGGAMLDALRRCGDVRTLVMTPGNRNESVAHPDPDVLACITFHHALLPWPRRNVQAVRRMVEAALAGQTFDLVVVRYLLLGLYVRPLVEAPFVLDADDLSKRHAPESAPLRRRLLAAGRKLARDTVTRWQLPRYAHVWFVNEADRAAFTVDSGSMLPNIAAPVEPAVADGPRQPALLFVGNLEYGPNVQAVDYFVSQCWPLIHRERPGAGLRIVGKRSAADGERWNAVAGVRSLGFVDDLAGEYARCALVVAPVLSGGGTQIKVLEALAHGCAAVVSDFVAAGFSPALAEGEHFLVARSPAQWASACGALLQDDARAASLGAAGRSGVRRHYSPESFERTVAATVVPLLLQGAGR